MGEVLSIVIAVSCGLVIGFIMTKVLFSRLKKGEEKRLEEQNKLLLKEAEISAENIKKEKIYEAKEKFMQLKYEFEEEVSRKKNQIISNENKVKQREQTVDKEMQRVTHKIEEADKVKETLAAQLAMVNEKKVDFEKFNEQKVTLLEKASKLTADDAREQLIEMFKGEARTKASSYIKDIIEEAKLTATKQAKKIVIETAQRTVTEHTIENCLSIFNINSDDVKGKIIGREGRNIRALEAATGIEIIVDDTPEAIIISGFDPVRREIARLSLHRLVTDGRIHPARIEEIVAKTTKNIEEEIIEIGERTVIDLGIYGVHPELIKMIGRMRFRSSYGQNLLQHSREVANLCTVMAAEFGLDTKRAKRAGLLHDIGKVWPKELEKPHAILGMELAQKYKEHPKVCNAIGAHHDEIEMTSLLSPIVQICDAISGARPGARREVMESYIKRLKDLEELASDFDGVNKCYAIQAGRELRVMVDADVVTDDKASMLSFEISQKIERDMQYPGQIKVTVIREMRSVSFAK